MVLADSGLRVLHVKRGTTCTAFHKSGSPNSASAIRLPHSILTIRHHHRSRRVCCPRRSPPRRTRRGRRHHCPRRAGSFVVLAPVHCSSSSVPDRSSWRSDAAGSSGPLSRCPWKWVEAGLATHRHSEVHLSRHLIPSTTLALLVISSSLVTYRCLPVPGIARRA